MRSRVSDAGPLAALAAGCAVFLAAALPVADLQAAEARAQAAADGVGQLYWLSWFGGSTPAQYSVLSPLLSSAIGAKAALCLATLAIGVLVRGALSGRARARSTSYVAVACALANLWSGRLAFAVGCVFALGALVCWQRRRVAASCALNAVASLASPLASTFLLLGLSGTVVTGDARRRCDGVVLIASTGAGLAVQAALFGMPAPMPFSAISLASSMAAVLSAMLLPAPAPIRASLAVTAGAIAACYVVPNGIGSNVERFAVLGVPVMVWAASEVGRRWVVLGLLPALGCAGLGLVSDMSAALAPSARPSYYAAVRTELMQRPESQGMRVEAIDTSTHGAANALVPGLYLARGWEDHDDAAVAAIFHSPGALTAESYRQWLADNAVGLVAVPSRPADENVAEAQLASSGLPYLRLVWSDADWRIYAVADPVPIVSPPAMLIEARESKLIIDARSAMSVTLRIRPSPYLRVEPAQGGDALCPVAAGASAVRVEIRAPGEYAVRASFSVQSLTARMPLLGGTGPCG